MMFVRSDETASLANWPILCTKIKSQLLLVGFVLVRIRQDIALARLLVFGACNVIFIVLLRSMPRVLCYVLNVYIHLRFFGVALLLVF